MPLVPTPLWGPGAFHREWPTYAVSSYIQIHMIYGIRLHGAFIIPREILVLNQRDQTCHHEVSLHLDLAGDWYAHGSRRNHDHRVHFKERSWRYPLSKENVGMMWCVTTHYHLYRRHENLCSHQQAQLIILTLTCGFHQRASRSSAFDLMSCLSLCVQLRFLCCITSFISSHVVTCPYKHVCQKKELSFRQWSDEFSLWVGRIDQDFGILFRFAAHLQGWDKDKFISSARPSIGS